MRMRPVLPKELSAKWELNCFVSFFLTDFLKRQLKASALPNRFKVGPFNEKNENA